MNKMKNILIVGAGGVAGIGMTRCLQNDYTVFGEDIGKYAKYVMETKSYNGEQIDLVIPVPDSAIPRYIGRERTILPDMYTIALCQDKAECVKVLDELSPKTYWIRDTRGAGGAGAQMASQYLPGRNYSCELAYWNGKLLGYFIKERLSYSVKDTDKPIDKRGSSAVSICIKNALILERAKMAIRLVTEIPHGAFGVDFKEDEDGVPLITEINAGRFLTASYTYFYSTGYNLPLALVKAYFGEEYILGEYPQNKIVIRQTDCPPKFLQL